MSLGTSQTMKKGVRGGIVAVFAVVFITAIGLAMAANPETVLESSSLIYVGWVSALTFLGCLGVTKYYDHIPDSTPVHKLVTASALVGIPAFASGLLLPTTRPFAQPYPAIPDHLTVAANLSFIILGGIVTMWVFLYVFDWKDSSNPYFSAGEAPR